MTPEDRDRHIRAIIEREGGWVDDPDDSGGPTNYGITLAMWQAYCHATPGMMGRGTREELRGIDGTMAIYFYRWYFRTQGLDALIDEFCIPDDLVPLVMDMRTHHSMGGCRKILWDAAARMDPADDLVGGAVAEPHAAEMITLCRMRYMLEVAERRPKDRKYVRGWMHRALKAIDMWPPQDLPEVKEV